MADPVAAPPPAAPAAEPVVDPKAPAPPPESKVQPRTFKAKINGREVELPEDEVIESGLTAAQIRRAAQERFDAAQKAMAEVQGFREAFTKDPVTALRHLAGQGPQFRKAVEEWLTQEFQIEQADPATKARIQAERERDEAVASANEFKRQQLQAREAAAQEHYRKELDAQFSDALEKAGLPRTTEAVRRMAQYAMRYNQMGAQIDPQRIARLVKQDLIAEQVNGLAELDGEALLRAVDPKILNKIRAADVARVRASQQPAIQPVAPKAPQPTGRRRNGPEPVNPHLVGRDEWYRRQGIDPDKDL